MTDRNVYINTVVEQATTLQLVPDETEDATSVLLPLDKSFAVGTGGKIRIYGCTVVQVISDTHSYTAHLWEGDMGSDATFKSEILDYLDKTLIKNKALFANGRAFVFAFTNGAKGKKPHYRTKIPMIVNKVKELGCIVTEDVYFGTVKEPANYLAEYDAPTGQFRAFCGAKDVAPFKVA